jgi:hypothetical protein
MTRRTNCSAPLIISAHHTDHHTYTQHAINVLAHPKTEHGTPTESCIRLIGRLRGPFSREIEEWLDSGANYGQSTAILNSYRERAYNEL